MARGRMLNKSVSLSQKFAELPDDTCRLLATWTIAYLDYRGVFYADAAIVRSQVMPLNDTITNAKVNEYIQAMVAAGLVKIFEHKGRKWQFWPGFSENQVGLRIDREGTEFPPPPADFAEETQQPQQQTQDNPPDEDGGIYSGVTPEDEPQNRKEKKLNRSTKEVEVKEKEIGADAPDSLPRKNRSTKDTDDRSKHPAILAFREVTQRYPAKEFYDELIALCGESPDIPRMRQCWVDWLKVSNNRYNTTWIFDWYANGCAGNPDRLRRSNPRPLTQSPQEQPSRIGKGLNW